MYLFIYFNYIYLLAIFCQGCPVQQGWFEWGPELLTFISSWIYEKVLFENTSTLTKILLNWALNQSNGPESKEKQREEGKEEGEKKTEHPYVFISSTLNDKKPLLRESYSLASLDRQQGVHPRDEIISIVFINPARSIDTITYMKSVKIIPVRILHNSKLMETYLEVKVWL